MPRPGTRPGGARLADAPGVLRVPVKIGRTPLPDLVVDTPRDGWTLEAARFEVRHYVWRVASSDFSEKGVEDAALSPLLDAIDAAAGTSAHTDSRSLYFAAFLEGA